MRALLGISSLRGGGRRGRSDVGVSMGGSHTKASDMKMASGDLSQQLRDQLRFQQICQENVEVAKDGRTARFRQRYHPSVITTTRPLQQGDIILIHVSGSGHAQAGLVRNQPSESTIRDCRALRSQHGDYLLHFRLKKTEADVRFLWQDSSFIQVERIENNVLQTLKLSSQYPMWPMVDILFGDVKVTMQIKASAPSPSLTFDPSLSGANIQLSADNLQASPRVEFPRSFCWAYRELSPGEVVKLEMKSVDQPRWFWVKIYLTLVQPEVLAQSDELFLFQKVPKSDWTEVKKVRNHNGVVELMVMDCGDRRELSLTCQASRLSLHLKQWSPDRKIFLCLELFRIQVQISSYIAETSAQLDALSYAIDPSRKPGQASSGDYLTPIASPSRSPPRSRPIAFVPPSSEGNAMTVTNPDETFVKGRGSADASLTVPKWRQMHPSTSSSSQESLETGINSGREEEETFCKFRTGHSSPPRNRPFGNLPSSAPQTPHIVPAAPFCRQKSAPGPSTARIYSEDGYDDFILAEYGEPTAEDRPGYESLRSLQKRDPASYRCSPSEELCRYQTVQSLVARFEDLKQFASGNMESGFRSTREHSELALEVELEWIQQRVENVQHAMHTRAGTKAAEELVEKLGTEVRKMSCRYKKTNIGRPPFYCKLRDNYVEFLDGINAQPVAEYLFSKRAITEEDLQKIVHEITPKNKSRLLMSCLLNRPNAEEKFCEALQYSEQQHLLPLLHESS